MMDINEMILEFYSDKSLKDLEKEYNIDQRKIRKVWRNTFSEEELNNRKYRIRKIYIIKKLALPLETVNKMYELLESGNTTSETAKILKISTGAIHKYLSANKALLNKIKQRNKISRSTNMKYFRKHVVSKQNRTISEEKKQEVMKYFNTDLFVKEISEIIKLSEGSIKNIFQDKVGETKYRERVIRLKPKRIRRTFEGLINAGKLGSKPELLFYNMLNSRLHTYIKHHDLDIMPPFEIDITIPDYKIAVFWDGIGHHKPIFGINNFKQVVYRDKQKRKYLDSIGWQWFEVIDLQNHYKLCFINEQFENLLNKFPILKGVLDAQ